MDISFIVYFYLSIYNFILDIGWTHDAPYFVCLLFLAEMVNDNLKNNNILNHNII